MTGKETLENIKEWIKFVEEYGTEYQRTNPHSIGAILDKIQEDLEVLEILKRIDWLVFNNGDKNDFNWYIDTNKSMKITEEEANKIKEWLEDVKRT